MTRIKVYLVLKMKPDLVTVDRVLGAKLTRKSAQLIAKKHAPCKVELHVADKSDDDPSNAAEQAAAKEQ